MARRTLTSLTIVASLLLTLLPVRGAGAAPPAPVTSAPDDGATLDFPTQPPLFRWDEVTAAASYKLEVDNAPDFIGAASYTTKNTSYVLTEPQTIDQPWYWHVQAIDADGIVSDWSPTMSYSISWSNSQPTLLEPVDGGNLQDVALEWMPVPGAATYQVQVSPNGDWANNVSFDAVVKGTRYSPPTTLNNASYFWRVRARDAAATPNLGQWSLEWQFTRTWTEIPVLVAPADGDLAVETPTLAWDPVPHASHYEVQIGTDVNFTEGTFTNCYTNHTQYTPYIQEYPLPVTTAPAPPLNGVCGGIVNGTFELQPGVVYHWRVRGIDGVVTNTHRVNGQWSDVSDFLFRGQGSDIPELVSPADGATVGVPMLQWAPVDNIDRYRVTIDRPSGADVIATTRATSWTPTTSLGSNGPFTWYVQTVDSYGKVGIAPAAEDRWSFTLEPQTAGDSITIVTPPNGTSTTVMPPMTWTALTGAAYYEVWYSGAGVPVETALSGTTNLPYTGFTSTSPAPSPGAYTWRVRAYDTDGNLLTTSPSASFTLEQVDLAAYAGPCSTPLTACTVTDTPTLAWDTIPFASFYRVYIALDEDFTNIVKRYNTQYTTLTPRESLFDNQAGQSYYWFVRGCRSLCGPFDRDVFPSAFAFRKRSNAIELVSPADGSTVANLATFDWTDFLATNLEAGADATQEARQYKIQVSTVADFATIFDEKTVDQTTFTPYDRTYPEGTLYWRVQAIDGSGNALTRSAQWSVTKESPQISLEFPDADVKFDRHVPFFQWTPQDYAAKYTIEVFKNGDLNFSPTNKILSQTTKMSAWSPTTTLAEGVYAWRVRRLDADGKPGPWSEGRRFTLGRIPTEISLNVTVRRRIWAAGDVAPDRPGGTVKVTLYRYVGGAPKKVKISTVTLSDTSHYAARFRRPDGGLCEIVARFTGDSTYQPSVSEKERFTC